MRRSAAAVTALLLLCGCFKEKDELIIHADGSGTIRMETRSSIPAEMVAMLGMYGTRGVSLYPPLDENGVKALFPASNFNVSTRQQREGNESVTVTEASFQDIHALLNSPYGRAHQLSMEIKNGQLFLRAISGAEAVARAAEIKADGNDELGMMLASIPDAGKRKEEMSVEFRVTMPGAVVTSNGDRDGNTAVWKAERKSFANADDFATRLGTVFEASWAAADLQFTPATPPRLGLDSIDQLVTERQDVSVPVIDTNRVMSEARFVPYALRVTRAMDLSGSGAAEESRSELTGAIIIPAELKPQKWGREELEEVVDSNGNNLKPDESDDITSFRFGHYQGMMNEEGEVEELAGAIAEHRHPISLTFLAPEWTVNEIASLKGTVALRYYGGAHVIKLTNAIPQRAIMDPSRADGRRRFGVESTTLNHPGLSELGMTVRVASAAVQFSMMHIQLQIGGSNAAVQDVQVFDASGRPWPTLMLSPGIMDAPYGEAEKAWCGLMVIGTPAPPLSLALSVSGSSAAVNLPFQLENLSINPK